MRYSLNMTNLDICDHANNGKQALDAVKKNVAQNNGLLCQYNLILMDCNMPFMDGYDATKFIREFLFEQNLE